MSVRHMGALPKMFWMFFNILVCRDEILHRFSGTKNYNRSYKFKRNSAICKEV
jgi:hypothetical protein